MAIAAKSLIFMRRYEDTDFPFDFLAIFFLNGSIDENQII